MKPTYTLKIERDINASNPVEDWAMDGDILIIVAHRKYAFGTHNFSSAEQVDAHMNALPEGAYTAPLFMFDHGGVTVSLEPFSCPWDSGQVGFVVLPDPSIFPDPEATAKAAVEALDDNLTGNVFGWVVEDENGDPYDSCWDYYGDPETSGCREDGEDALKRANEEAASLKYCHDFDILATLESNTEDFEKVSPADIRKALLRRINSLTDDELHEAVGHVQTVDAVS